MTQRFNSRNAAFGLIAILCAAVPFVFYSGPESFVLPRAALIEIFAMILIAVFVVQPIGISFPLMLPFAVFLVVYGAAAALSPTPILCVKTLFYFLCGVILCRAAAAGCGSERHVRILAAVILAAGSIMAVHGMFQFFRIDFPLLKSVARSFRVFATAGTPAALSGWLCVCLCLSFGFMVERGRARILVLLPLWLLSLACIALAFSRSGLIAAAAGMIVTLLLLVARAPEHRTRALAAAFACVFALAVASAAAVALRPRDPQMSLNPAAVKSRYYDSAVKSDSLRLRAFTLEAAYEIWRRAPLLGRGPGTFAFHYPGAQARIIREKNIGGEFGRVLTRRQATHAHNEYAEIAAESGIFGFVAFLFLIFTGFVIAFRARGSVMMCAAAGGMAALAVQALFEFTFHFPLTGFLFMTLLGICCSQSTSTRAAASAPRRIRFAALLLPAIGIVFAVAPLASTLFMTRGVSLARGGDLDAARMDLNRAAALDPASTDVFLNRASVRWSSGDASRALRDCDAALSLSRHPRVYLRRAYFLAVSGNAAHAERDVRAALAVDPWLPHAHYQLAQILLAQNRAGDAVRALHRALRLDPGFEPARALLRRIGAGQSFKTG